MKKILKSIFIKIFDILKVDDKMIVFESNPDMSDSSYALFIYIKNNYPEYKCVWCISKNKTTLLKQQKIKCFNRKNKILALYYLSRAKYLFYTHTGVIDRKLKPAQKAYNIWHGSPGKKFAANLIDNNYNNHIFVTSTEFTLNKYVENYGVDRNKSLLSNHLRNDFFDSSFSSTETNKANNLFNFNNYKKNIIFLPTFRRNKALSKNFYDNFPLKLDKEDWKKLDEFLKVNKVQLIIKNHPMVENADMDFRKDFLNIRILSSNELVNYDVQLYSILGHCDALISDFSSVVYDYMMLNRPIGYVVSDLDYFKNSSNNEGFVFNDIEENMAGEQIKDFNGLIDFITDVINEKDKYREKRHKINDLYNNKIDNFGTICERFCYKIGIGTSGYNGKRSL